MLLTELANFLQQLESTSSRLAITQILSELFKKADADEIDKIVYLVLGSLAPQYEGLVFNLADRLLIRAVSLAYQLSEEKTKAFYQRKGDLGTVVAELAKEKGESVTVSQVYQTLRQIAEDEGENSQERKINHFAKLLKELDPLSAKYVIRIPLGKLRLGFSDKTVLDALSWLERGDKSAKARLEKSYQVVPDVGLLAKRVKDLGIDKATKDIQPVVGVPVLPMLAQRLKSPKEMIEKMGKVFVEPKFDGLRVLIHFKRNQPTNFIKAFTRNLNDVSNMFTELTDIGNYINARQVILDTEAVGMDPEMVRLADFQTTMRRRRKYQIDTKVKEIPLRFQVFDIITKDGKSYLDTPYHQRREILKRAIKANQLLLVDEATVTDDPEVINQEYRDKIRQGLEGVIVKKYDTAYVPGRRGWRWVKMKEAELAVGKLADTVDCVVMGYYAGRGKRASFGLGGFLVGVGDGDTFKSITKIGTGLTDVQFRNMFQRLKKLGVKAKPKQYSLVNKILIPDFRVTPSLIVEIAADEITKSPSHSAGFALRFPRLVRFRFDKSASQITTVAEIKKLYSLQRA
ncbi:hypothetical protein A3A66_03350 [Microgenomates group bacterium RIFCSPLOWO2_01_FULL_46_13]|nr:MAG: hypothetical protein A3A66_03350 [Microgenomates group bacterium RIFCSPLOWO2_01_FULL_46_13]